ncbi:tetratricopeptide repeat protein [Kolteria novifilia]|uniref:tetratricopeptide repeat protein n=1 Tax=Kolteria novifilia TaxID=2527975 RepID=UPI003AF33137
MTSATESSDDVVIPELPPEVTPTGPALVPSQATKTGKQPSAADSEALAPTGSDADSQRVPSTPEGEEELAENMRDEASRLLFSQQATPVQSLPPIDAPANEKAIETAERGGDDRIRFAQSTTLFGPEETSRNNRQEFRAKTGPSPSESRSRNPVVGPMPGAQPKRTIAPAPAETGGDEGQITERSLLLQAARNAVALGDFDIAVRRYESLLQRDSSDVQVRREFAGVLLRISRLDEAARQYRMLLEADPNDIDAIFGLAIIRVDERDYAGAEPLLRRVLAENANNKRAAILLALTYTFRGQIALAEQLYRQYLSSYAPDTTQGRLDLGKLFLEIGRPRDAISTLQPVLEEGERKAEVLSLLIRSYALATEWTSARESILQLGNLPNNFDRWRLELGSELFNKGYYTLALAVYAQVLNHDPSNSAAVLGAARCQTQLFAPAAAMGLLNEPAAKNAPLSEYMRALAEYHTMMGEYADAKLLYRRILDAEPSNDLVRMDLASLFSIDSQNLRAKGEYSKIPGDSVVAFEAKLGVARELRQLRYFQEAIVICREAIAERPRNAQPVVLLAKLLIDVKQPDAAIVACRKYLAGHPPAGQGTVDVAVALGQAHLAGGDALAASVEFERALMTSGGRSAEAYQGLWTAREVLGEVPPPLDGRCGPVEEGLRFRMLLADAFLTYNQWNPTIETMEAVLQFEPGLVPALNRLADAQAGTAFEVYQKEAIANYQQALASSHTNVRARLGLARNLADLDDYESSIREYDLLVSIDSDNFIIKRERARVLFQQGGWEEAGYAYHQLQVPSADQILKDKLSAYLHETGASCPSIEMVLHSNLHGSHLANEIGHAAHGCQCRDPRAIERLLVDYEVTAAEQTAASLEGDAKSKRYWRNEQAIPLLESLEAFEPSNEEAYFDLGQTFAELKWTRDAIDQYGKLLEINPNHQAASTAIQRSSLELNPRLLPSFRYFNQRGRDGLAQIQRFHWNLAGQLPVADQNEYVGFLYSSVLYVPTDDRSLQGNIFSIQGQKRVFHRDFLLYGILNYEEYADRIEDRPTFDIGFNWRNCDFLQTGLSLYLENVVENGESLRQDIYRGGVRMWGNIKPLHRWDAGGMYDVGVYSDNNTRHGFNLYTNYLVCLPPRSLKLGLSVDFFGYTEQTIFGPDPNNVVLGAIHPYFSPSGYAWFTTLMEWKQWLSDEWYTGATETWYSLRLAPRVDTQTVFFADFGAVFHHDFSPALSFQMEAGLLGSRDYNVATSSFYLIYRSPL